MTFSLIKFKSQYNEMKAHITFSLFNYLQNIRKMYREGSDVSPLQMPYGGIYDDSIGIKKWWNLVKVCNFIFITQLYLVSTDGPVKCSRLGLSAYLVILHSCFRWISNCEHRDMDPCQYKWWWTNKTCIQHCNV